MTEEVQAIFEKEIQTYSFWRILILTVLHCFKGGWSYPLNLHTNAGLQININVILVTRFYSTYLHIRRLFSKLLKFEIIFIDVLILFVMSVAPFYFYTYVSDDYPGPLSKKIKSFHITQLHRRSKNIGSDRLPPDLTILSSK